MTEGYTVCCGTSTLGDFCSYVYAEAYQNYLANKGLVAKIYELRLAVPILELATVIY
jgi:hypothetical protein